MIDSETMVKAYLNLRSARERLARQYEQEDAKLLEDMSSIEKIMMQACDNVNATSIKTSKGTIIKSVRERYGCTDWEMFNKFVYDHNALELFEKRIHQTNMKQFMSEHKDDGLPPGLNISREYVITVRKSTSDI
jgi:hypothetical protein